MPSSTIEPPRVLVVDDDQALVRMLRLTLVSEGVEVEVAEDGLRGLEVLEDGDFNALILDLQMPRMDGRTMYREMRSRGHAVPVLILSAYGADRARSELGAEAALRKPFDIDVLIGVVWSLVKSGTPS